MKEYELLPVGDHAVLIEFGNVIDEEINKKVIIFSNSIRRHSITGVIDVLSTYRSVMVFYDNSKTNFFRLKKTINKISISKDNSTDVKARKLLIPVCYEDKYSKDLYDMESALGLSKDEIINIHSEGEYKVFMLGFLPGFVYLGGLDKRIHMPRLETPRTTIPERSVGIGGNQTGVYPMESPGGWRLIGKTPVDFYNPQNTEPILCQPGDYIKFFKITSSEYKAIRTDVQQGNYIVDVI